ncbi:Xaa-Pro aminopeptidase [Treponema pallidum subsp. pallidum str. Sea 81-4]|nr:Xaa-Pro aminopeptidase [Treponema pallidum subsp. pallidum str. Sea 81-4]ANA42267.1 Xaa-Pro aminopeptidase [Treponema pallidum subsp. pallidum]
MDGVRGRLSALRSLMRAQGVDICYISGENAHGQIDGAREYFSGFTGSAGIVVVTAQRAFLWTDGRYFIQAERELSACEVCLFRTGQAGVPRVTELLRTELRAFSSGPGHGGGTLAVDGRTISAAVWEQFQQELVDVSLRLDFDGALLLPQEHRVSVVPSPAFLLDERYTGLSAAQKLTQLRAALSARSCDATVLSTLDDVCWLTNVRAHDVPCTPLLVAYMVVTHTRAFLYVDMRKISSALHQALYAQGVECMPYDTFFDQVCARCADQEPTVHAVGKGRAGVQEVAGRTPVVLLDFERSCAALVDLFRASPQVCRPQVERSAPSGSLSSVLGIEEDGTETSRGGKSACALQSARDALAAGKEKENKEERGQTMCFSVCRGLLPTVALKALKNDTERANVHQAMIQDGIALVKTLQWVYQQLDVGADVDECAVAEFVRAARAVSPSFIEESFHTIAGYGANAAMVHYRPVRFSALHPAAGQTAALLRARGFLLLDSGAHYREGTTDVTRTLALGPLTDVQRADYTLVLQAHSALARARFPAGTSGAVLDGIARAPLWAQGRDYPHGTGHGVGFCLSVHEGPYSISPSAPGRGGTARGIGAEHTGDPPFFSEEAAWQLRPGMLLSNEPGVYVAGSHGVRIENLMWVVQAHESDAQCVWKEGGEGKEENAAARECTGADRMQPSRCRSFYGFQTATLCPIDTRPLVRERLHDEDIAWLNAYHLRVYVTLAPFLDARTRAFLRTCCRAL